MSYLINIKNNREITVGQLLESRFVPEDTCLSGGGSRELPLENFSRLYLLNESSRGVVLTITEEEYIVELNIGASAADYLLAARLAMAIAEINQAVIFPDFDDELSLNEFESKYDENWAHLSRLSGVDSFLKHLVQKSGTVKLPGCIRGFYFGSYMLDKLCYDNPNEELFTDRVIEEIKKVQFIEQQVENLEVPTLMDANFPDGVKTVLVILPGYKLLVQKSDYIILRAGGKISKIDYEKFINYELLSLDRLDEEQYILQPIQNEVYMSMMDFFLEISDKPIETEPEVQHPANRWWQFWKK